MLSFVTFSHAPKRNSEGRCYIKVLSTDYAPALESVVDLRPLRISQARKRKVVLRGKGNISVGGGAAIFVRTLHLRIGKVSCFKVLEGTMRGVS